MNSISCGKNATISTDVELYDVSSNYIKLRFFLCHFSFFLLFFFFFGASKEYRGFIFSAGVMKQYVIKRSAAKKHALANVFISDFKAGLVSQSCDFIRCLSSVLGLTEKELEFSGHCRSTLPGASDVPLQFTAYDVWHGGTFLLTWNQYCSLTSQINTGRIENATLEGKNMGLSQIASVFAYPAMKA